MTGLTATDNRRRLLEAFAQAHHRAALAEDVVVRDLAQERTFRGRDAAGEFLDTLFGGAFAGVRCEAGRVLLEGEAAALTFVFCGRHEGTYMGLPPTRQTVTVPMVIVLRLADGAIAEADLYYNAGTLLRQVGLGL